MLYLTAVGRVGKDAEVRTTASGQTVTSFSLAVNTGWGERETTRWLDCSMWGNRGEKIADYIRKGMMLTVVGEMGQREYEGKTYDTLRVADLVLPPRNQGDSGHSDSAPPRRQAAPAAAPAPTADTSFEDDDIPF